jgi:hypothetical protein
MEFVFVLVMDFVCFYCGFVEISARGIIHFANKFVSFRFIELQIFRVQLNKVVGEAKFLGKMRK